MPVEDRGSSDVAPAPSYRWSHGGAVVELGGALAVADTAKLYAKLRRATPAASALEIDLSRVSSADGGSLALLASLREELGARGVRVELRRPSPDVAPLLELYTPPEREEPVAAKPPGFFARIGAVALGALEECAASIAFVGEVALACVKVVRRPRSGHLGEALPLAERAGADAVPIVLLINFLVGFVMAYQSAKQLKMFGANIYVADLVGISVTRELCPLMTAIILAGRSGAAFAAEIGSMKVSEEIDALRTLGLAPHGWLVLPRTIALVAVAPVLALLGDVIAFVGGLVVAVVSLDLTPGGFLRETQKAVHFSDVGTGLVKCTFFAAVIALIACQQGFSARGGAEGVGRRTTSTVVTSLFAIVLFDALFTVVFRALDL
ncbi:MAG TPA: MlaE family lipid ABC transporter permease subunit [Byssovorax sp.]|jgi:phospholipid/cholesterol/gamma-HCH transport system permease protein